MSGRTPPRSIRVFAVCLRSCSCHCGTGRRPSRQECPRLAAESSRLPRVNSDKSRVQASNQHGYQNGRRISCVATARTSRFADRPACGATRKPDTRRHQGLAACSVRLPRGWIALRRMGLSCSIRIWRRDGSSADNAISILASPTSPPDRYRNAGVRKPPWQRCARENSARTLSPIFPQFLGKFVVRSRPKLGRRGVVHHLSTDFIGLLWWARQGLNL